MPGHEYRAIKLNDIRVGLLICADVLYPSSFSNIAGLRPDLIVVPVTAPYRDGESIEDKFKRDQKLFVEGAKKAGCPVIKVSSVGRIAGRKLQGRSLIATPEKIIFRVAPEKESEPILKIMEMSL